MSCGVRFWVFLGAFSCFCGYFGLSVALLGFLGVLVLVGRFGV